MASFFTENKLLGFASALDVQRHLPFTEETNMSASHSTLLRGARSLAGTCLIALSWIVPTAGAATGLENPREVAQAFERHFNAGDVERLMSLYERGGVLVPAPGQAVRGAAGVRESLQRFLDTGMRMSLSVRDAYVAGDMALLLVDWNLRGMAPSGEPVELAGTGTDVVRRGADGSWRYVIDNPFGVQPPAR